MIAPTEKKTQKNAPTRVQPLRIILMSVAALMVIAGVIWFVSHSNNIEEPSADKSLKSGKITEVKPVATIPAKEAPNEEVKTPDAPLPPQKPHEVRDGMLMLSNGELLPTNKLRKVSIEDRKPRFKYAIFEHSTDNELAAILTLRPGQSLIGGPIRRGDYKAEFLKSIETPVVVHKDDPEDVQEVKRAVIDARLLIKEAIDRGEDPAEIIKEAYEEAQKLALYKDDIRREVMNMAKDGDYTDQEVDDLIEAANKMLESKGIEPMNLGPVMKARLRTLKR